MDTLEQLLTPIPLPRMVRVRQRFDATQVGDIPAAVRDAVARPGCIDSIRPGDGIAIAVGSRGIRNLPELVRSTVDEIRRAGGQPFIVPSMGSHGGATAEGQQELLAHLGITEETVGAPIQSSMEVVQVGELANGLPVFMDRFAYQSDGVVVINRIKPHTAFRGPVESGLLKMLAIGLGKQKGAEACHQVGFKYMAENVPQAARAIIETGKIRFGVGIVENAYDNPFLIQAIPAAAMEQEEPDLLSLAKQKMPRLPFDQIDVLVIDYIGKNISGDGMDPNITGRYPTPYATGGPDVNKMVVLDLTPESSGNANGVGTADFTTRRLVEQIDYTAMYANGLTSTVASPTKVPMTLANHRTAIQAAIKTCNITDLTQVGLVRIRDTLHLGEFDISEAFVEAVKDRPDMEIISDVAPLPFDADGNLF